MTETIQDSVVLITGANGAIAQALTKPGHAVAIVNLRSLLAPGGVLQQLQARGFKIAKPDEITD